MVCSVPRLGSLTQWPGHSNGPPRDLEVRRSIPLDLRLTDQELYAWRNRDRCPPELGRAAGRRGEGSHRGARVEGGDEEAWQGDSRGGRDGLPQGSASAWRKHRGLFEGCLGLRAKVHMAGRHE